MIKKYKMIILYIIFGILTTLINIFSYFLFAHILKINLLISTAIAWVISVGFAYITNRKWVFDSQKEYISEILKEMGYFFLCRFATGVFDLIFMYIFASYMGIDDVFVKTLSNVFVIILNYVFSKFIIFK